MSPLTPQVTEIVLSVMEGLRCPRALTVAIMIRENMWYDLMNLDIRPSDYLHANDYRRAAAATKFLSKLECTIPGLDPAATALKKWWEAEHQCFRTNQRLNQLADFGSTDPNQQRLLDFFEQVRKNMAWLIGSRPPEFVEGIFGPGATISDKSGRTSVLHKMSSTPTYTSDAVYHLFPWSGTKWSAFCARHQITPRVVRGNHYFQVPKNAKTNRSCAKEPSLNAFFQRGYGAVMASRLARRGITISPKSTCQYNRQDLFGFAHVYAAPKRHIDAARAASKSHEFATIDLSSASDTICTALVRLVLPPQWSDVLDDLRSPYTFIKGKWVRLEKYSSMGNGFTFELETALFTAICMAVDISLVPGVNLLVFGDDIIVPSSLAKNVINALEYCGFSLNAEKSYTTGHFRESCGGDYWDGESVRPYHLKEHPNEPQEFIGLANGIRRLGVQNRFDYRLMADLRPAWFRTLDCIPRSIRVLRGPTELGDLVIHDDDRYIRIRYRQQKGWIKVYRPIKPSSVHWTRFCPEIQFAGALYGVPFTRADHTTDRSRMVPIRGPVGGYKIGWASYG